MSAERLYEILTAIRAASDASYRRDLVDKALVELARRDREVYAARAAAVRILARGEHCDVDTLRTVQSWANNYGEYSKQ